MEVTIKEGDPNWIGAWWLGFPVIGTCIVIFAGKVQKKRAKSFTSLMADLRQDINRVSSFRRKGALMEHFFEGIALLRHWYINPNEKRSILF